MAGHFQAIAVISGRPVNFLQTTLGSEVSEVVQLFGRYGAERLEPDGAVDAPEVAPDIRRQFTEIAEKARRIAPRVRIEDKQGSLALHWRESPASAKRLLALANEAVAGGLEVRPGKQMVDLVVPGAPTKGTIMAALLANGANCGCFLGDDVGDLETFDVLDTFEATGGRAVRIAVASAEMPVAFRSRANLILANPSEAAEFLRDLAATTARP
jgi:trehalose 6-phosphate phosphatase